MQINMFNFGLLDLVADRFLVRCLVRQAQRHCVPHDSLLTLRLKNRGYKILIIQ